MKSSEKLFAGDEFCEGNTNDGATLRKLCSNKTSLEINEIFHFDIPSGIFLPENPVGTARPWQGITQIDAINDIIEVSRHRQVADLRQKFIFNEFPRKLLQSGLACP